MRALASAQRLQALGKTYEPVVHANDGHDLPMHRHDAERRVVEWFRRHLR